MRRCRVLECSAPDFCFLRVMLTGLGSGNNLPWSRGCNDLSHFQNLSQPYQVQIQVRLEGEKDQKKRERDREIKRQSAR